MSSNEAPKNREEQRDDPGAMWGGEEWPPFKGKTAEAKTPKTYRMEITSDFRSGGTLINRDVWKQWFYDKDKGTNKDETYFNKMLSAIDAWNSLSSNERTDFLASGDYTESVNEDLISLLTSSGIIDFAEPSAPPTGPGGPGGPGEGPIGPGGPGEGPIGPGGPGGGEGPIGPGGPGEGPTGPGGPGEGPTGTGGPGEDIPTRGPGGPGGGEGPIGPGGPGEGPTGTGGPGEGPIGTGGPGEDTPTNGPGGPGGPGEDVPTNGPGETDDDGDGDDSTPQGGKRKKRPGGFWGWIFGGRRKKKKGGEAQPAGSDEDDDPDHKEPKPKGSDVDEIIDEIDEITDNPEMDDEEIEKHKVLLVTKVEELPPAEREEVRKKAAEARKKLIQSAAKGLGALLALALLMNPIEDTHKPGEVTGTRQETQTVMVEPGRTIEHHEYGDPIEQTFETTSQETIPAEDVELGNIVELEPGTELHYTSDRNAPNFDRHYTVKDGDKLVVNRLAVYDKDGNLIGTRHMSNGDEGKISEMIQQMAPEGEYTIFLHYANPSGGGIDQHQDLGWSDAATVKVETTTTHTMVIPGEDNVTYENVPPVYETQTTETNFSGEVADNNAGSIEVTNEDGSKATINIRNADGSLVQPGDVVLGTDGCSYQIESVSDAESGTRINGLKLAHDIAVVGTGIAVFALLNRKKKGEGGGGDAPTAQPAGGETAGTGTENAGEIVETRTIVNLTSEQLQAAMKQFTELAGDQADTIAQQFAEDGGLDEKTITELMGEQPEDSIYVRMTPAERIVAATLLHNLHEPSSVDKLTQALGTDYESFIESIGVDESAMEEITERKPNEQGNASSEEEEA